MSYHDRPYGMFSDSTTQVAANTVPTESFLLAFFLLALLALAACTATAVQPVSPLPLPTPTATQPAEVGTPQVISLPLVNRCHCSCPTPEPCPTDAPTPTPTLPSPEQPVTVLNCQGIPTSTAWLSETFGAVTWTQGATETARLDAIVPCCDHGCPAVVVVHVQNAQGAPVAGATVVFHWDGAPILPVEMRACGEERGVYGSTNGNGDIGFGLGSGSYYWPPDGGPHVLWIAGAGPSACLRGIGMIAATDHYHPDSRWTLAGGVPASGSDAGFSHYCPIYIETIAGYGQPMPVIRCFEEE